LARHNPAKGRPATRRNPPNERAALTARTLRERLRTAAPGGDTEGERTDIAGARLLGDEVVDVAVGETWPALPFAGPLAISGCACRFRQLRPRRGLHHAVRDWRAVHHAPPSARAALARASSARACEAVTPAGSLTLQAIGGQLADSGPDAQTAQALPGFTSATHPRNLAAARTWRASPTDAHGTNRQAGAGRSPARTARRAHTTPDRERRNTTRPANRAVVDRNPERLDCDT